MIGQPKLPTVGVVRYRLEEVVARSTDAIDRLEAAHRLTARLLTDRISEKPAAGQRATTPH